MCSSDLLGRDVWRAMKYTVFAVVLFATASLAGIGASAQDFDRGMAAAQSGDFAAAVQQWRPLADQGDPDAQSSLGYMYEFGLGVAQNEVEAAALYGRAAEQGFADAQFNLAAMYDDGRGVALDDAVAANWYELAAEQGHVSAQYNLGLMYKWGEGVEKSDRKSTRLNSSHVVTSYAVFCLKKKNNKTPLATIPIA